MKQNLLIPSAVTPGRLATKSLKSAGRLAFPHFQGQEVNELCPIKDAGNCSNLGAHNPQERKARNTESGVFTGCLFHL